MHPVRGGDRMRAMIARAKSADLFLTTRGRGATLYLTKIVDENAYVPAPVAIVP
jgi:hypothetical protein